MATALGARPPAGWAGACSSSSSVSASGSTLSSTAGRLLPAGARSCHNVSLWLDSCGDLCLLGDEEQARLHTAKAVEDTLPCGCRLVESASPDLAQPVEYGAPAPSMKSSCLLGTIGQERM